MLACRRVRTGLSRLALVLGLLGAEIPAPRAEEPPRSLAAPQVRGVPFLQERAILASVRRADEQAANAAPYQPPTDLQNAYACLIGGTAAVATALAVGGENATNLIAGGIVPAQSQAVLYVGMVGVVFAVFCSISQSLLPIYTYHLERPEPAPGAFMAAGSRRQALPTATIAPGER